MIAVALRDLAARKVRAPLAAFAVVIGVSMASDTFIWRPARCLRARLQLHLKGAWT
jgi:hypothetical protein